MAFEVYNDEDYAQSLANLIVDGKLTLAKNIDDSTFRKLLRGLSIEHRRMAEQLNLVSNDYYIPETTQLIEKWESAVGIPDECISVANTLDERRDNILLKLRASGTTTVEDFEEIALLLGFIVTITPLEDVALPPYDVPFIPTRAPASSFIVLVTGANIAPFYPPYDVPFLPSGGAQSILECIFNLLKPANMIFVFVEDPTAPVLANWVTDTGDMMVDSTGAQLLFKLS